MSSSTASYPSNGYMSHEEHESSPDAFSLFDYARSMHEHTRKQMEAADKSARRRSANSMGSNTHATLRTGHDATTSMDSSSSSSGSSASESR
ncbi:uncharacterized protein EAF02_008211 [Botrytis sinoallii]|uniref:uncharacterized protein n=1 Tax=Botrytis sinoallii TaxID=1463999 RepID=UPI0018FF7A06|nr:uncharacterized protein EAF02_008211 [Botrytis sinoallii]KAF7876991.1 hypothetical protein EAF02_008211 [Botrytis sinoallii]